MDWLFPALGVALIVAALSQMALWTAQFWRAGVREARRFDAELTILRHQIEEISRQREARKRQAVEPAQSANPPSVERAGSATDAAWQGFRPFRIARIERENELVVSVYLQPEAPLPLPDYLPGQHLTVRLAIPGQPRPVVRCYTLSDAPGGDCYRLTIKRTAGRSPGDDGVVSSFVHDRLAIGDIIEVKAPMGKFVLQRGESPVVLLAGGIGITPMLSMLQHIAQSGSTRQCLLVYGVRNSGEATFAAAIRELTAAHSNLHVIWCFSRPLPHDALHRDYHVAGHVSLDVLRRALPSNDFDFYLCGPAAFMQDLYNGLREWGVGDDRIRFESFGPASIARPSSALPAARPAETAAGATISLGQSGGTHRWTGEHETILDWCEARGIEIDSGCRAGNCGTCETRLTKGRVRYLAETSDCEPGCFLPCVSVPDGPIEIDA